MVRSNSRLIPFVITIALFLIPVFASAQLPCDVVQISHNPNSPVLWSPDSSQYIVNEPDSAGVFQIYSAGVGDTVMTCISLNYPWSFLRPWSERNKLQVQWHPSGDFIICGVEKEFYNELLYVPYSIRLGFLESGIWMEIWAVTPDGNNWYNLNYNPQGFTGPAFTPNGNKCVWADAQDSSNLAVDVFGVWKFMLSDFVVNNGIPSFANTSDISPAGSRWLEPGNFAPDGVSLLFNSDIGMTNAEGQDQYILDISNGNVTNLTNSPMIWDEHGVFSPDGTKILFMSSYPYQADTNSYHTFTIKTEFMLMNTDGSGLQQLTHYCDTGYVESSPGIAATGFWGRGDSTIYAQSLVFPNYDNWIIKFYGDCGNDFTSAVEETESADAFSIYPNPAFSEINIAASNLSPGNYRVEILNLLGQTEYVQAFDSGSSGEMNIKIPVQTMSAGTYLVRIKTDHEVLVRKLLKQ